MLWDIFSGRGFSRRKIFLILFFFFCGVGGKDNVTEDIAIMRMEMREEECVCKYIGPKHFVVNLLLIR